MTSRQKFNRYGRRIRLRSFVLELRNSAELVLLSSIIIASVKELLGLQKTKMWPLPTYYHQIQIRSAAIVDVTLSHLLRLPGSGSSPTHTFPTTTCFLTKTGLVIRTLSVTPIRPSGTLRSWIIRRNTFSNGELTYARHFSLIVHIYEQRPNAPTVKAASFFMPELGSFDGNTQGSRSCFR
jgi:hypothetical protein